MPDLADYGTKVTVRQMIHHISGIPDYEDGEGPFLKEDGSPFRFGNEDYYTIQEFYDHAKNLELEEEPEVEFSYSNTGCFFLSQIVESVTGKTLREFAADELFTPLNMQNSFFNDNVNEIVPHRADGYRYLDEGQFEIFMTNENWVGDDSVFTSLDDFIKWYENFYDNKIGSRGSGFIEMLETPHAFFDGISTSSSTFYNGVLPPYAWGMLVNEYRGLKVIGHTGGHVGYRAFYTRYPEFKLSFVTLCNVDNALSPRRIDNIRDKFLDVLELPLNS